MENNSPTFKLWHLFGTALLIFCISGGTFIYFVDPYHTHANFSSTSELSEAESLRSLGSAELRENGSVLYKIHCATCHGFNAQGIGLAPNLSRLSKGPLATLVETISVGREQQGMPAWRSKIQQRDILAISVYLKTTYGH